MSEICFKIFEILKSGGERNENKKDKMITGEIWEFILLFLLVSCTFENFYSNKLFLKTLESFLQ